MCEQSGVGREKLRDEFLLKPITAPFQAHGRCCCCGGVCE